MMPRREVGRGAEPGLREAAAQIGMAVGAELLRRRRHALRAFMLGMAFDATAGGLPDRVANRLLEAAEAGELRRRPLHLRERSMVMDVGVAGLAGIVLHRLERLDVAGLAIGRQRRVRAGEITAAPHLIGVEAGHRHPVGIAAILVKGDDRPDEEEGEDEHRQHPGDGALARHHALQREAARVEAVVLLGEVLVGALDIDRHVLAADFGRQDAQQEGTDLHGAAGGQVDLAELGDAAVNLDGEPGLGGDTDPGRGDQLQRRMVQGDREVVQPDVAIGIAADLQQVVIDPGRADDLATVGAAGDISKQERHALLPPQPQ